MLEKVLKKYDKYLGCRKNLDGSIQIFRQSPYTTMKFNIFTIENEYLGSYKWILRKLNLMDSSKKDFITEAIKRNRKIKQKESDTRMSNELADFMLNEGMTFVS
jgi:hypothetical protein